MKKSISTILLIGLTLIFTSSFYGISDNEAVPAKCAMMKFDKAYENAKAVFVGEVISVKKDGDKKFFTFKVKKYWKGVEEVKVKVFTYENRRYTAPYDVGETHLVFAKDDENGGLWDGRCSRSKDLEGSSPYLKEDLKKLGEGKTCIKLDE